MVGMFVTAKSSQLGYPVQGWVAVEEPELIIVGMSGHRYRCDKGTKYVEVDNPPIMPPKVQSVLDEYRNAQNEEEGNVVGL